MRRYPDQSVSGAKRVRDEQEGDVANAGYRS